MEILSNTLFWICVLFSALSFVMLLLVRHSDTPRWLDIATGIMLIASSALFLGMLADLQSFIPTMIENPIDQSKLHNKYAVAILIIPFISAAIGTNLISHALTYNHSYKETRSFNSIAKEFLSWLWLITSIVVFPILLIRAVNTFHNKRLQRSQKTAR